MRGTTVLIEGCPHVRGGLYEGLHCTYRGGVLTSGVAFMRGTTVLIEGCPHVRGGHYEGLHCTYRGVSSRQGWPL